MGKYRRHDMLQNVTDVIKLFIGVTYHIPVVGSAILLINKFCNNSYFVINKIFCKCTKLLWYGTDLI